MENREAEERGADSEEVKQRQRSSPCRAWGRESRGRHRRWGRLELDLGEETSDLGKRPTSSTSSSGGSNQHLAGVERRLASRVDWRAAAGSLFCFYPLLSHAPNRVPHGARPIGTSARHAHPSPALPFPRCLSRPVAGSLSGRGAGLPRHLSPPHRLPRASASAEATAPLRGCLWPEAKRQPLA